MNSLTNSDWIFIVQAVGVICSTICFIVILGNWPKISAWLDAKPNRRIIKDGDYFIPQYKRFGFWWCWEVDHIECQAKFLLLSQAEYHALTGTIESPSKIIKTFKV